MAKLRLLTQNGSLSDAQNITFQVVDLKDNQILSRIENVTHSVDTFFSLSNSDEKVINGTMNLNIPEGVSQSLISLFAYIEELNTDNDIRKTVQVCPATFYLSSKKSTFNGKVSIEPSFINVENTSSIRLSDVNPNNRYIFSINDKRMPIFANQNGFGSTHFIGKDLLTEEISTIQKFPVFCYSMDNNYTQKQFTGSYLTILPNGFKTTAIIDDNDINIDPRCLLNEPWVIPDDCLSPPIPTESPVPEIPVNGVPVKDCNYDDDELCDCENPDKNKIIADVTKICRISDHASTMLHNGMVLHAYISADSSLSSGNTNFGINNIYIAKDSSSIDKPILAARNAKVAPLLTAGDAIQIYVTEDIAIKLISRMGSSSSSSSTRIWAVIFDKDLVNLDLNIVSIVADPDPYSTYWIVTTEIGKAQKTFSEWLNCQYVVFFDNLNNSTVPDINITAISTLPFIYDNSQDPATLTNPIKITMACNADYIATTEGSGYIAEGISYIYIIAEAMVNGQIQLFLYSFSVGGSNYTPTTFGWKQLTYDGENKNPKATIDKSNTLHIVWESNRTGKTQIYYGVAGPSSITYSNSVLSSLIDKEAEFNLQILSSSSSSSYIKPVDLLIDIDPVYYPISNFTLGWSSSSSGGSITQNGSDFVISGTPIDNNAIIYTSLNTSSNAEFSINDGLYSQLNFQLNFESQFFVTQESSYVSINYLLSDIDKQNIYNEWKNGFVLNTSKTGSNEPIYTKDDNDFTIGYEQNIYDRFIPFMGSFAIDNIDDFKIIASGSDANLKPFMIGLIPEKIRFKATNILNTNEYTGLSYIGSEEHEIFTGKAKLVILYSTFKKGDTSSSIIVRNIDNNFNLWENKKFEILVHYSKLYTEDIAGYLNTNQADITDAKFICNLVILNGIEETSLVFAESFITKLDTHRSFEVAFGIPQGGQYFANEYMPYNSSIFERNEVTMTFRNIAFSSPLYIYNPYVCNIDSNNMNMDIVTNKIDGDTENLSSSFFDQFTNRLSLGMDINSTIDFTQIPITLIGENKSPYLCEGIANDIHIVWESNRNNYWDIYTGNSYERNLPFRQETRITDTESNSLAPSIAVCSNGKRLITWHDNRDGKYEIYGARSFDGYISNDTLCRSVTEVQENLNSNCEIDMNFVTAQDSICSFTMQFYFDAKLTNLYTSISTHDSIENWSVDGVAMVETESIPVLSNEYIYSLPNYEGLKINKDQTYIISYIPTEEDYIFDKLLYVKMIAHKIIL
jgi:hypothetical protein